MSVYSMHNIWQSDILQNGSNGSTKVTCPECCKEFVHPRNLVQHQRSVHKQIRYYCQDCDHSYTRQYNLTHHRLKAHPEKLPPAEVRFLKRRPFSSFPSFQAANQIKHRALYNANPQQHFTDQMTRTRRKPTSSSVQRVVVGNGETQGTMTNNSTETLLNTVTASVKTTNSAGKPMAHVMAKEGKPLQMGLGSDPIDKLKACLLCPFVTEETNVLKAHITRHSKKIQQAAELNCKFCDYKAHSFGSLVQHGAGHFQNSFDFSVVGLEECSAPVQKEFLRCTHCDRKFDTIREVEKHEKLHQI